MRTRIRSAINNYPPRWLSILTMNEKIFHASTSVTPLMKTKLRSTCYCYELFWWRKSFEIEYEFEPSESEKENVRDSQIESVVKEKWSAVGSHIFCFSNRNKSIQIHKKKKKKMHVHSFSERLPVSEAWRRRNSEVMFAGSGGGD